MAIEKKIVKFLQTIEMHILSPLYFLFVLLTNSAEILSIYFMYIHQHIFLN